VDAAIQVKSLQYVKPTNKSEPGIFGD